MPSWLTASAATHPRRRPPVFPTRLCQSPTFGRARVVQQNRKWSEILVEPTSQVLGSRALNDRPWHLEDVALMEWRTDDDVTFPHPSDELLIKLAAIRQSSWFKIPGLG